MKRLRTRIKLLSLALAAILLVVIVPVALAQWPFGDVPVGHWAYNQIRRVAYLGITAGCGEGNYCPNRNITRAEMAVFIDNLTKAHTDENEPYIMSVRHEYESTGPGLKGDGIRAYSYRGAGLRGQSALSMGVSGSTAGSGSIVEQRPAGVYGYAGAASGNRVGGWFHVNGTGYGVYTADNIYVGGSCTGCTMVFVAQNTSQNTLQVGDVVVANGVGPLLEGHTAPVLNVRQATAQDAAVLGVVYARGEFYAGSDKEPEVDASVQPVEGKVAPEDYLLVVTSGLAQVRIAPAGVAVAPGQSLTLAEASGQAAVALAETQPSLVFGRAMEAQPDKNGLIWAMISTR